MDEPLTQLDTIEAEALVHVIHRAYGYDFSAYSPDSRLWRLRATARHYGCNSLSQLQHRLLREPQLFGEFLSQLSVSVTQLFRDAEAFLSLKHEVIPYLQTFSRFKVWHAGCASGEELYSLAIMLGHARLLERARLYGTDINLAAIAKARDGIVESSAISRAEPSYQALDYGDCLRDHFTESYGAGLIAKPYRDRALFSHHNLASDANFGSFELILCRNVLIYFDTALRERALSLFHSALEPGGYLCLGNTESIARELELSWFEPVDRAQRLYRKRRGER